MRVRLTEYEQSMLRGEQGEAKRVALGKIVELAEILGAEVLVPVTKAHLCCGTRRRDRQHLRAVSCGVGARVLRNGRRSVRRRGQRLVGGEAPCVKERCCKAGVRMGPLWKAMRWCARTVSWAGTAWMPAPARSSKRVNKLAIFHFL